LNMYLQNERRLQVQPSLIIKTDLDILSLDQDF
jgi:hypothetical protein